MSTPRNPDRSPSIGVAMCTYNGEKHVSEQLRSIALQTRRPDSLLVVDDQSTDSTVRLVREFAATAPFPVRVTVNGRNLGYRENFARAIAEVDGEVIVLSDQDDVWYPQKLQRIETEFRTDPGVALVFSDADVVDDALRPLGYRMWEGIGFTTPRQSRVERNGALHMLLRRNVVTGATMAFRSDFREVLLPIPEGAVHDGWISLLISACAAVRAIPEPLIAYRQHASNQIGARRETVLTRVRHARVLQRDALVAQCRQLLLVRSRLVDQRMGSEAALRELDDAVDHLRARLAMPSARAHRFPAVCRELINGRYMRRANGFSSALRDLVI